MAWGEPRRVERRFLPGDPRSHTWENRPEWREENDGLGMCNTGSRSGLVCALGGLGCDVDHISVARGRLRELAARLRAHRFGMGRE